MTRILTALAAILLIGAAVFWFAFPDLRDEAIDSVKRLSAPEFILAPYDMKSRPQNEWIAEYQNRGYNLNCYGNLRPEEHISRDDDYACWAIIKSAYDNIPAKMVSFHFHKGQLQHIRLEFPEKSFDQLQAYLNRYFSGVTRLDQLPHAAFAPDVFGKKLMVWPARNGVLVTSKEATPGQTVLLLWTSKEALTRDLLDKKEKAMKELQKLQEEVKETASAPAQAPAEAQAPAVVDTQEAMKQPVLAPMPAPASKHEKPKHKPKTRHAPPVDADLRNCLDMPTDRGIAQCAGQ